MGDELAPLISQLADSLSSQDMRMATAESCTGGWIAQAVTCMAGSSKWFDSGFVTYSNEAKQHMLGVRDETLTKHGAVSEAVVIEMAKGAVANSLAEVAVSVSGVAGPGGGSVEKPVGLVWLAWARQGQQTVTKSCHFNGDREAIRYQTVKAALEGLVEILKRSN